MPGTLCFRWASIEQCMRLEETGWKRQVGWPENRGVKGEARRKLEQSFLGILFRESRNIEEGSMGRVDGNLGLEKRSGICFTHG